MTDKVKELLDALSALSELLGEYRAGLMRNGFTRKEALEMCKEFSGICWKSVRAEAETMTESKPAIKDSGERTVFASGAVRDMHEGKGDMVSIPWEAILRLSRHYENGAKKYERWNYRKAEGIPVSSYLDSAMRHLAKYMSGCDDEDHLSACAFNVLGAMLQEELHPEMNDLPMRKGKNRFQYFDKEPSELKSQSK